MRAEPARLIRRLRIAVFTVMLAAVLGYSFIEGRHLDRVNPDAKLGAAPLVGQWRWRPSLRTLLAVAVAVVMVWALPVLVGRASTRVVTWWSSVAAAVFGWALAVGDGWSAVIAPVIHPTEYWAGVAHAPPLGRYLKTYAESGLYYSVHVRGHPPGMMVVLIGMKQVHLHSPWAAAALSIVSVAVAVAAVAFTVSRLDGAQTARRAAPLLAAAPFALWQVTSADAFYAATAAVGVAILAWAATTQAERVALAIAVLAGVVFGFLLHLTYGAVTFAPVGVAVLLMAATTRRRRLLIVGATLLGALAVFGVFSAAGFWWFDGFRATRHHYWAGTAQFRPRTYFAIANLAVLAIALGPASSTAMVALRLRARDGEARVPRAAWLAVAAALGVALADVSQYSKGETERIWLLFMPWLSLAGVRWATTKLRLRCWLGVQVTAAVVLQTALVSKW